MIRSRCSHGWQLACASRWCRFAQVASASVVARQCFDPNKASDDDQNFDSGRAQVVRPLQRGVQPLSCPTVGNGHDVKHVPFSVFGAPSQLAHTTQLSLRSLAKFDFKQQLVLCCCPGQLEWQVSTQAYLTLLCCCCLPSSVNLKTV